MLELIVALPNDAARRQFCLDNGFIGPRAKDIVERVEDNAGVLISSTFSAFGQDGFVRNIATTVVEQIGNGLDALNNPARQQAVETAALSFRDRARQSLANAKAGR